jgi:hypothetical protein
MKKGYDMVMDGPQDSIEGFRSTLFEGRGYIAIPVRAIFRLPLGRLAPYISLGAAPSFNILATEGIDSENPSGEFVRINLRDDPDFRQNFRIFDLPVIFGSGVAINFRRFVIQPSIQYSMGTMSFVKRPEGDVDLRHDIRYNPDEIDQESEYHEYFCTFGTQVNVAYRIRSGRSNGH